MRFLLAVAFLIALAAAPASAAVTRGRIAHHGVRGAMVVHPGGVFTPLVGFFTPRFGFGFNTFGFVPRFGLRFNSFGFAPRFGLGFAPDFDAFVPRATLFGVGVRSYGFNAGFAPRLDFNTCP